MANKVDTSNQGKWGNAPGWDLVGGGSSGSSAKSGSSDSSKTSSGSSGGSRWDDYGPAYDKRTGVDYSRNQSLAGQTVRQGMYDVYYDDMGYAGKAVKVGDSPGYVVNGVTYDGNGNVVSGGGNYVGASGGVDQGTDYQAKINAAKAAGDYASAAMYEQLRNEKVNSPGYTGNQTATSLYSSYLPSAVSQKQQNYGTWEDFLNASGYQDYNAQVQAAIQAAVDAATQGYTQQIDTANQDSAELARQAYVAKMLGQKNLDQQLSASGYAGGMADSQRIQTESNYQNNLNSIEQQRLATVKELQSAISQARLSGNQQMAESLSSYLQNLQGQWSSYVQQQQSMSNADYWNQKQMDNSDYWNRQSLETQNRATARTNVMESLSAGYMPSSDELTAAGMSQAEAAAYRSVFLNGAGGTTGTVVATRTTGTGGTSGGYSNGSLTTAQVQQLQKKLGVTADGKWGSASSAKAGGLTAEQAWAKYGTNGMEGFSNVKRTIQTLLATGNRTRAQEIVDQYWNQMSDMQKAEISGM